MVTSGKLRKKALWNKIAKVLREKGNCNFSAVQVEGRWKTLMRGLKNVKDHNKKSGAERRNHPYEEELEFMAAKTNVQPECVVGTENKSSPETKSSKEESDSGRPDTPTTSTKRKCVSPEKLNQSSKRRRTNDVLDSFEQIMKNESQRFEEQVERRHREKMEMFGNFLEILKSSQTK